MVGSHGKSRKKVGHCFVDGTFANRNPAARNAATIHSPSRFFPLSICMAVASTPFPASTDFAPSASAIPSPISSVLLQKSVRESRKRLPAAVEGGPDAGVRITPDSHFQDPSSTSKVTCPQLPGPDLRRLDHSAVFTNQLEFDWMSFFGNLLVKALRDI